MKRSYPLAWLNVKLFVALGWCILGSMPAKAQFTVINSEVVIKPNTLFSVQGLTFNPEAEVTFTDNVLQRSNDPVDYASIPSVNQVYTFDVPITYTGTLRFPYADAMLNGEPAANLKLIYAPEEDGPFTLIPQTVVNESERFVEHDFETSTTIQQLSALASDITLPAITSATYNAAAGTLVVTGTEFVAFSGSNNDIDVSKLTVTGEGGATYALTSDHVEITDVTSFTVVLNSTDREAVTQLFNKNGTSSTGGTTYNLAAAEGWLAGADPSTNVADLNGNGISVGNVAVPAIIAANYDASMGTLVVTGTGFLSLAGANNDIVASKFTFTGEGGATYTLTDTPNEEISNGTSFTLVLSATDIAGVLELLSKNGTSADDGTTYNLAAAEDWAAGADAAVVTADLTGNGITASNVTLAATVTTSAASSIAATSATLGGNVSDDGGTTVTERGIVWNLTGEPTVIDRRVPAAAGGTGIFSNAVGLPAGRPIFVRAYAINSRGTTYGNEIEFTTPTMALPGNALSFNGNQSVQLSSAATLATDFGGTSSFTIEAWIKPDNFTDNPTIFGHKPAGTPSTGYALFLLGDGRVYLEGTGTGKGTAAKVEAGKWNHIAMTFAYSGSGNAGEATFYINGEEAGGGGAVSIASNNASTTRIGAFSTLNQPFRGDIDELKIWSAIRTKEQIVAGMTSAPAPVSPGLVLYYKFDQGIPEGDNVGLTRSYDASANGFDGQLNLFELTGTEANWVASYAMLIPVAAAASEVGTNRFTANWSAPANDAVDSYLLDVATDDQFTAFVEGYEGKDMDASLSETVTGLIPGLTYYYRVRAISDGLIGVASATIAVNTLPISADDDNILYVDKQVSGGNNTGDSWENAIPELADALKWAEENSMNWTATDPLQIWVAKGTYKPLYEVVASGDVRDKGFKLINNVQLYGGFDPDNAIVGIDDDRLLPNPASGVDKGTVLSGDLDNNDHTDGTIVGSNAYHVVLALGVSGGEHLDENTVLDGFTITGGKADDDSELDFVDEGYAIDRNQGGGMVFGYAYPTVRNVTLRHNQADYGGGAAVQWADGPPLVLTSVSLMDNEATIFGGGIYALAGVVHLRNALVAGNHVGAVVGGSGIHMGTWGDLHLTNVTLADNTGGAVGVSRAGGGSIILRNSVIWNNVIDQVDEALSGYNRIGAGEAMFVNVATNDYGLVAGSTAVNAGDPATELSVFPGGPDAAEDLARTARVQGSRIDIGAFESAYEDVNEVDQDAPIAITAAFGTALDQVTIPTAFTVEVTLTDGSVEQVEVDSDTDNWVLVDPAGGGYDGNVAGTYEFEVPLIMPGATDNPWFTNTQELKASVALTVDKDMPSWSVALGGETAINGSTLNRTYGDAEQLTFELGDWDGNALDITFDITEGEELVDISGFPMLQGIGVGTVEVEVTLPETDNYESDMATFTVMIAKKAIAIVPVADQAKVYGAADPTEYGYALAAGSELVDGDGFADIISSASREAGEDVGTYDINITFEGTKADNYDITFDTNNNAFAITSKTLTVTVDAGQSKVYGSADPELTYSATGFALSDDESILTGTLERAPGEDVNAYAITQGDLNAGDNYTIAYTAADFVITPATLAIIADARQGKMYGSANPALTFEATGFELSDDESILTGALERALGEDVGSYAITQGTMDAGDNYTIAYTGADFAVTPATLAIIADAGQGKIYGSGDPALTFEATGFALSDDESILTGALERALGEDVGSYAITQGTVDAGGNYTIAYTGADFAVTPATLAIIADAGQGKIYGSGDPALTFEATGFELSDDESILTGALERAPGEDVGSYAITQSTVDAGANYTIAYTGADFAVTPATLAIIADAGQGKIYGSGDPVLTFEATGFALSDDESILTGALERAPGEDVGSYAITQGTLDAVDNYTIVYTGADFAITPATLTITSNPEQGKVYGSA
ncbi:MBG domain-containing protein, partial [Parapedobacter pyrenivorans]